MESDTLHQLHTLKATAARLAVSMRTLRRLIDLDQITVVRVGRSVRVNEAEIRRCCERGVSE